MNKAWPAVDVRGMSKVFPGVIANDRVDFTANWGEIHCLLGENGAGKSTLMNILSGMLCADAGAIRIDGCEVIIDSPRRARELGIGMVHQHPSLVPAFSLEDNLLLGDPSGLRLRRRTVVEGLSALSSRMGVSLSPADIVGELPLARQQQAEIVKRLLTGTRILILDEPTAVLSRIEASELGELLRGLREQHLAIIFITHKLPEAVSMADRITVMRSGAVVGRFGPDELARHDPDLKQNIVGFMFGGRASSAERETKPGGPLARREGRRGAPQRVAAEPLLDVRGLTVYPGKQEVGVADVSFAVSAGELFGVAGVEGNGQRELAEALVGQRALDGGQILLRGRAVGDLGVSERRRQGMGYVSDDRWGEGLAPSLPLSLNLFAKELGEGLPGRRWGHVSRREISRAAGRVISEFEIDVPSPDVSASVLSGGNAQKCLLARELASDPALVVYHNPTQGLDLRTANAIRDRILRMAHEGGVAGVLISPDLDELLLLCERIAVLAGGRLRGIVDSALPSAGECIASLMVGAASVGEAP